MEFGLSTEQTLLQETLNAYLREQAPLDRVRRFADRDEGRAADLIAGLAGLGLPGLLIPEAHGGVGLSMLDACLAAETLGYHVAPVPFAANAVMVPTAPRRIPASRNSSLPGKNWKPGNALSIASMFFQSPPLSFMPTTVPP